MNPATLCGHCTKPLREHAGDKCLFDSTTFEPDFYWNAKPKLAAVTPLEIEAEHAKRRSIPSAVGILKTAIHRKWGVK